MSEGRFEHIRAMVNLRLSKAPASASCRFIGIVLRELDSLTFLKRVRDLAFELPENERAALELLSSLDSPADAEARQAWEAEITKRLDELMTGNARTLDVDETLGKVDARISPS